MYPQDCRFSEEHEWVRKEGEDVVVGITDFAQSELGDVVYVELPEVSATFEADDEIGTIESVKAVAEVYTPLDGEILEVNSSLEDSPEKVNDDPHGEGWLFRLRPSAPEQIDGLLSAEAYEAFISSDSSDG